MVRMNEPLWSDERIRNRYHALVPSEADMGELEYWNTLRDVGERVSYELRDDYDARIAELEAQSAQRWEPLPDGTYDCQHDSCKITVDGEWLKAYDELYSVNVEVALIDNIRLCRLVERAEVQPYSHRNGETEPPTVAGRYWFDGYRTKHNGNRAHVRDMVEVNERGSVYNDVDGLTDEPHAYKGKWYGPIVPPWEVDHE